MSKQSDYELVSALSVEVIDRYKLISNLLKDNVPIQKHLAAAAIHLALFLRDIEGDLSGEKINMDEKSLKKFLDACGCKDFI